MKKEQAIRRYWRSRVTGACTIGRGWTFNPELWEEITYEEYIAWRNK